MYAQVCCFSITLFAMNSINSKMSRYLFDEERDADHHHTENSMSCTEECFLSVSSLLYCLEIFVWSCNLRQSCKFKLGFLFLVWEKLVLESFHAGITGLFPVMCWVLPARDQEVMTGSNIFPSNNSENTVSQYHCLNAINSFRWNRWTFYRWIMWAQNFSLSSP